MIIGSFDMKSESKINPYLKENAPVSILFMEAAPHIPREAER